MCDDADQGARSEQRTAFHPTFFSLSRLVADHLLKLNQKRALTREDFSMPGAEVKPFGAIDLWKFLKFPPTSAATPSGNWCSESTARRYRHPLPRRK